MFLDDLGLEESGLEKTDQGKLSSSWTDQLFDSR